MKLIRLIAAELGLEPRLAVPETAVLPLDDSATFYSQNKS